MIHGLALLRDDGRMLDGGVEITFSFFWSGHRTMARYPSDECSSEACCFTGLGRDRVCSQTWKARICQTRSEVSDEAESATKAQQKAAATHEYERDLFPRLFCSCFIFDRAVAICETRRKALVPRRSVKMDRFPLTADRNAP